MAIFTTTSRLRWLKNFLADREILQQEWISGTGEIEWRNVPVVHEKDILPDGTCFLCDWQGPLMSAPLKIVEPGVVRGVCRDTDGCGMRIRQSLIRGWKELKSPEGHL